METIFTLSLSLAFRLLLYLTSIDSFSTQAIISLRSLFLFKSSSVHTGAFGYYTNLKMETLSRFLVFMSLFSGLVSGFALQNLPITSFEEGYTQLFGDKNLFVHKDGKSVRLTLDERTGMVL